MKLSNIRNFTKNLKYTTPKRYFDYYSDEEKDTFEKGCIEITWAKDRYILTRSKLL